MDGCTGTAQLTWPMMIFHNIGPDLFHFNIAHKGPSLEPGLEVGLDGECLIAGCETLGKAPKLKRGSSTSSSPPVEGAFQEKASRWGFPRSAGEIRLRTARPRVASMGEIQVERTPVLLCYLKKKKKTMLCNDRQFLGRTTSQKSCRIPSSQVFYCM